MQEETENPVLKQVAAREDGCRTIILMDKAVVLAKEAQEDQELRFLVVILGEQVLAVPEDIMDQEGLAAILGECGFLRVIVEVHPSFPVIPDVMPSTLLVFIPASKTIIRALYSQKR